jgi:hypothetical protein
MSMAPMVPLYPDPPSAHAHANGHVPYVAYGGVASMSPIRNANGSLDV